MNRETARFLLSGAHAFLNDKKLQEWEGCSRENFILLLTSLFKEAKTFSEAVSLLEQVVTGEITAPSLPPDLAKLISDWERAKEQKEKTRQEAGRKVQEFIYQQEKLTAQKRPPFFPLAEAAKKVVKAVPTETPSTEEPLPQAVLEKLESREEGVAFAPLYVLLQPQTTASFAKKVVLSPVVKILQALDKTASDKLPEAEVFREMLHQGLTSADIETSVVALEEAGLPWDNPKIQTLERKRIELKVYEQNHPLLTSLLKNYHEFSKMTGRRQVFLPEIKTHLPSLAQRPVWQKKEGYSWNLRRVFNQAGSALKFCEKVVLSPGKTVIRFTLPDKFVRFLSFGRLQSFGTVQSFVYRKTAGAVFVRLGKTALGQSLKKGASFLLTKLSLAAIPEPVVSKVLLVASFAWDAAKGLFRRLAKKLSESPLGAIILGLALALPALLLTLPLPLTLLLLGGGVIAGGIGLLAGAAKFAGGLISSAGGFLGGAANLVGGLFSSLAGATLPSALPLLAVGGGTALIAGLTTFTILDRQAAFITPVIPEAEIGPMPTVPASPTGVHLAERVVYRLNNECGIMQVTKGNWQKTKECLEESSLPGKDLIIKQFEFSVHNVDWFLQCVGFVRGVMDALGKDLGGGKNARDYLKPPPGYRKVENRQEVTIGDLAVWQGREFGHIAIVVRKEGNVKIVVAQAWGNNGDVNLTETTTDNPTGFIGPL